MIEHIIEYILLYHRDKFQRNRRGPMKNDHVTIHVDVTFDLLLLVGQGLPSLVFVLIRLRI